MNPAAGAFKTAFSFLTNDAFLFIVMALLDLLRCGYAGELSEADPLHNSTEGSDDMTRVLRENTEVVCWQGEHLPMASAAVCCLTWYTFTAVAYQNYVLLSRCAAPSAPPCKQAPPAALTPRDCPSERAP